MCQEVCAGGGRNQEGWRDRAATRHRTRNNGDGLCCRKCEEPATAPSPPVLRMYVYVGCPPWRSVVTEGHRAWARRFFNPYEFYITMFNEEKET